MAGKLVVVGGRKPQMRKASKRSWTQAKAREFLSALGAGGSVEFVADQPTLTLAAADVASAGSGAAVIQVRQVGDWTASRAAEITLALP